MESRVEGVVHGTAPVTAAASAAVAPGAQSELDQRPANHLLLMILLSDLLVDEGQRRNDSAVHGSHEIRVVVVTGLFHHHHGDVVDPDSGRLLAVRQEVGHHLAFALDFDPPTALELVRLVPQHLIHFLRHQFDQFHSGII